MMLEKIDKAPQTLRDIVQARMREAIIGGVFAPGERLVERPLHSGLTDTYLPHLPLHHHLYL